MHLSALSNYLYSAPNETFVTKLELLHIYDGAEGDAGGGVVRTL